MSKSQLTYAYIKKKKKKRLIATRVQTENSFVQELQVPENLLGSAAYLGLVLSGGLSPGDGRHGPRHLQLTIRQG